MGKFKLRWDGIIGWKSVMNQLQAEIARFIDYVKSSKKVTPAGEILMPGELESRNRAMRSRDGIELDDTTWNQIRALAESFALS